MTKYIVNQDRDEIYPFDGTRYILTIPVIHEGLCLGYNLLYGNHNLGTFEQAEDAVREVERIYNCNNEIYAVSGYSEWRYIDNEMD